MPSVLAQWLVHLVDDLARLRVRTSSYGSPSRSIRCSLSIHRRHRVEKLAPVKRSRNGRRSPACRAFRPSEECSPTDPSSSSSNRRVIEPHDGHGWRSSSARSDRSSRIAPHCPQRVRPPASLGTTRGWGAVPLPANRPTASRRGARRGASRRDIGRSQARATDRRGRPDRLAGASIAMLELGRGSIEFANPQGFGEILGDGAEVVHPAGHLSLVDRRRELIAWPATPRR